MKFEIEEDASAGTAAVLQHEVAIEQDALDLGQHAVVPIEVRPASLHHADLRLGEMVDDLHQPVFGRHEVSVEDGDELAGRGLQSFVERAGLVAVAVGAVEILDRMAETAVAFDDLAGDPDGFVGGVVKHLDLELVGGIVELATGID